jgi:hypothetical protein
MVSVGAVVAVAAPAVADAAAVVAGAPAVELEPDAANGAGGVSVRGLP